MSVEASILTIFTYGMTHQWEHARLHGFCYVGQCGHIRKLESIRGVPDMALTIERFGRLSNGDHVLALQRR